MSFLSSYHLATIPRFAVVLGIMVIVHELGHFIAAKLCGVRVEAFAVGFGKRLFGFVHNGTDYCVNLIPLGGYVKMTNETPDGITTPIDRNAAPVKTNDPGDYQNHPRWQRTLITLAGPVANFILAFVLMAGLYMFDDEVPAYATQTAIADYVTPDSPAGRTGIQPGDKIVLFDDQENPNWGDLEQRGVADMGQTLPFAYIHNGKRVDTRIFDDEKGRQEDYEFEKLGLVPVMQSTPLEVSSLQDQTTPAARAGLQPHDLIESIDNMHPHSVQALISYLQVQAGKPANLMVRRQGPNGSTQLLPISITPYLADSQEGKAWHLGFVNLRPPVKTVREPIVKAFQMSWVDNVKNSRLIFDVLHRLFTHQVSVKSLSSPIGMATQVNEAADLGWFTLIATMAMISLNLGIFNLLPIPILDGGMILFLAIESLLRRDVNQAVKERVYQIAFVCLILFAAVVIFNDITKLLPSHLKT